MKIHHRACLGSIVLVAVSMLSACGGGGGSSPTSNSSNSTGSTTTTPTTILYVSDTSGNDANTGLSPASAKKTIAAAISAAGGKTEIHVAGGTYSITFPVTLVPDLSLLGGYSADFSMRDPATNTTTIFNANTGQISNFTVVSNDTNISTANTVDGFVLDGGNSGLQSTAVQILHGSPTISNNTIIGGEGSDPIGIRIAGGSAVIEHNVVNHCRNCVLIASNANAPVIDNNTITAYAGFLTTAINASNLTNAGTSLLIENNTIYGGDGGTSSIATGIYTQANTAIIRNNRIDAGSVADNTNGSSYGIRVMGGNVTIINNDIYGGDGGATSAGIEVNFTADIFNNTVDGGSGVTSSAVDNATVTANTTLRNNIMMTSAGTNQYCIYDNITAPVEVSNNDLFNCSTAVYYDNSADCTGNADGDGNAKTCTLSEMESLSRISNGASGNVSVDPMFAAINGVSNDSTNFSDDDWHLTNATPPEVDEGGLDLSADLSVDFDNQKRTAVLTSSPTNANAAGWSMGAYEYNP